MLNKTFYLLLLSLIPIFGFSQANSQYPDSGNKIRLGFQTSGDGLIWRDTQPKVGGYQPINNKAAWIILDTINNKFYHYKNSIWTLVGGALTMPFDSITFNTAKNGTVGVGEVEYNDTQGSLIQGLKGGNVTNVIGQQLHQRVNNRTGAPLAKGDVVYLAGSQGNRITVAKGLAVSDAFSANTFGVVAENIADNQSGFIITEGLITGLNTSALTEDSAVYLSPTVAGALTSTKPQAPQHSVYIGVCVKSNNGSGELFVKIRNGQELDELHDVRISNPINNASLYYKLSEKLWRDTTAALLVSDTASMLAPYFRDADTSTLNLTSRFAAKQNTLSNASASVSGILTSTDWNTFNNKQTAIAFAPPLQNQSNVVTISQASSTDNGYLSISDWNTFNNKLNLSDTASMLTNYLRSGTAASTYLPLTGGTLTGGLTGTTGTFNTKLIAGNLGGSSGSPIFTAGLAGTETEFHIYQGTGYEGSPTTLRLTNNNGFYYQNGLFLKSIMERGLDEYNGRIGIMGTDFMILTKNSRIGIFNASPSTTLDVNGTLNATGATTLGSTLNVTSNITANSFIKSGGLSTQFLKADGTVDGTSYLPLTGGTLTGTINRQESNFNESPNTLYFNILNYFARKDNVKENQTAQITFTDRPGTSQYPNAVRTSDIYLMTAHNWNGVAYSQYLDTTLSIVANQDGGRVGISKLNPSYKLDVNGTLGVTGATTLNESLTVNRAGVPLFINSTNSNLNKISLQDNTTVRSYLGAGSTKLFTVANSSVDEKFSVSNDGNTVISGSINVNSSAVFNEGAADADFRVESIGNNNMVFVDASTDRVGIGTNSPTKTLDVNGELKVLSAGTFGGRLNTNWMERTYSNSTSTSLIVSVNTTWLKLENNSTITLTLPNAADYPGKELHIKNAGTGAVNSLSSNIEPLNSTTIGTAILASGGGKWATLVSDGTYWVIMAGN